MEDQNSTSFLAALDDQASTGLSSGSGHKDAIHLVMRCWGLYKRCRPLSTIVPLYMQDVSHCFFCAVNLLCIIAADFQDSDRLQEAAPGDTQV